MPFSVTVTLVALPPKVLPDTVMGDELHVLPDVADKLSVGELAQPPPDEQEATAVTSDFVKVQVAVAENAAVMAVSYTHLKCHLHP